MAITRRQFIKRTGLATAGSFLGPSLFSNPFLRKAMADTLGDRYFIVIFLDGGNDGLNTITPYDNSGGTLRDDYQTARSANAGTGGIQLLPGQLLVPSGGGVPPMLDPNTSAQLGFHPGLAGIKALYDQGMVAVIQGCGYPQADLSHDDSRHAWQTALNPAATGWVGRYLAANYTGNDIPAVCIRGSVAPEFVQRITSVLALRNLNAFAFPADTHFFYADTAARRQAFYDLYTDAGTAVQDTIKYVGDTGKSALLASESYPQLSDTYEAERATQSALYTGSVGSDLREVAKVIYGTSAIPPAAGVEARFFELATGGFDTHSNQGGATGQQFNLFNQLAGNIQVFFDDIADMQPGLEDKVCVFVWSEFARRIAQNDNGTDHGTQGPALLIGGSVNGGVYGNHPNILKAALNSDGNTKYTQNPGDGYRSTDIRDIYGTIMKHWLNMPEAQILSDILPLDGGNPNNFWTVQNFDLGFI